MSPKTFLGIDHFALQLPDLAEGLRFFHELLGFKIKRRVNFEGHQIVMLQAGKVEIEIWQNPQPDGAASNLGAVHHIGIPVKDLEAVIEYVRQAGIEVCVPIYEVTPGIREAIVRGPGGLQVQFVEQNIPLLIWRSLRGEFKEN